jgi:hypothetical protein
MMRCLLPVLFCLASCATTPTPRLSLTVDELKRGLADRLGPASLADQQYLTVSRAEVEFAAQTAWRPWIKEVWDCDDQCASMLLALRERWYLAGHRLPPAVGTVIGNDDGRHRVVWWIDNTGKIHLYDAGARSPARIQPPFTDVHDL